MPREITSITRYEFETHRERYMTLISANQDGLSPKDRLGVRLANLNPTTLEGLCAFPGGYANLQRVRLMGEAANAFDAHLLVFVPTLDAKSWALKQARERAKPKLVPASTPVSRVMAPDPSRVAAVKQDQAKKAQKAEARGTRSEVLRAKAEEKKRLQSPEGKDEAFAIMQRQRAQAEKDRTKSKVTAREIALETAKKLLSK